MAEPPRQHAPSNIWVVMWSNHSAMSFAPIHEVVCTRAAESMISVTARVGSRETAYRNNLALPYRIPDVYIANKLYYMKPKY